MLVEFLALLDRIDDNGVALLDVNTENTEEKMR
jgi:hypothetical protein